MLHNISSKSYCKIIQNVTLMLNVTQVYALFRGGQREREIVNGKKEHLSTVDFSACWSVNQRILLAFNHMRPQSRCLTEAALI